MLRGPSTIQRKRRLVAPTSQASYKGALRSGAEAARRVLFAGFGAVDNRGPSVRLRPLYSTRQRSYSASPIPTERKASATGKPSAVSVSIICSLWTISLGLNFDRIIIATPERRSTPQASDRPPRSRAGQCALSGIRKLAGGLSFLNESALAGNGLTIAYPLGFAFIVRAQRASSIRSATSRR